jgi:hypothetical protein
MAEITTRLNAIVQKTVADYLSAAYKGKLYYAHNQDEGLHTVLFVPDNDYPVAMETEVVIMARVVDDTVIIEQDTTDKPLALKLQANGIPPEQIIVK